MKIPLPLSLATLWLMPMLVTAAPEVTFESLLREMAERDAVATFAAPRYHSLQASSYNRLSTARDQPDQGTGGWFADSDGIGYIRTEEINGKTEWVIMEHDGPGAITRMWTPFFYYNFNNRVGPNIRIYLDGSDTPVIDQNFIELLTNLDWGPQYGAKPEPQNTIAIPHPFAAFTARAGVLHLPIPFAESCIVTLTEPAFYNIINYRAYPEDTQVRTFTLDELESPQLAITAEQLTSPAAEGGEPLATADVVPSGGSIAVKLPPGPAAVRHLEITLDPTAVAADPSILRSLVLTATFDGEQTVWCPIGEFFSSSNRLNTFRTLPLEVTAADGRMICRWVMPYRQSATIDLHNLGENDVVARIEARSGSWEWNDASMRFHANWRADDIIPGTPFLDWNFITIHGQGVLVGDSWTVLNLTTGWWGEGDEKIYIDEDYDERKLPSHFGTGTEDYYGWAGGVNPTREDEFSIPWASNVQVGSRESDSTQGYNINMRTRSLDAIPFDSRLVFDMEASAGTSQRNPWDLLMYSVATYWYGKPGVTHNRPPLPAEAARPITSFEDMQARSDLLRRGGAIIIGGAIEAESLTPAAASPGLATQPTTPPAGQNPDLVLSSGRHLEIPFSEPEQFVEFRITEQFTRQRIRARLSTGPGHGLVHLSVNGRLLAESIDTQAARLGAIEVDLGESDPEGSAFTLRVTSAAPAADGGLAAALDAIIITDPSRVGIEVTTDLAFVMDNGTARLFVNGVEENHRPFSAGGLTPIDTATLGAVVLGGHLFDNGGAPGGGNTLGAFHGSIHRFRAFVFHPHGYQAKDLLTSQTPAKNQSRCIRIGISSLSLPVCRRLWRCSGNQSLRPSARGTHAAGRRAACRRGTGARGVRKRRVSGRISCLPTRRYEDQLIELVRLAHERNCRARIYYTTRELTRNLPELHARHSMNGEIIFAGPGPEARTLINRNGPHPWLVENLGDTFISAWVDRIRRPEAEWDLSALPIIGGNR